MKHIFFKVLILLILFFCFISVSAYSYVANVSSDISESVFRLHVIANSDSDEDQNLKYKVRDRLLDYMNNLCSDTKTKEEAMQIANNNLEQFKEIAEGVVKENGYNYLVDVSISKTDFPTKTYGDIVLPAGNYDALNVKIGSSSGHNWWCVMFPPLCFVDVSSGIVPEESKEVLNESLDTESYDLITNNNSSMNFKFKLVEFFQNMKMKVASK